jgi:hypothetical protein
MSSQHAEPHICGDWRRAVASLQTAHLALLMSMILVMNDTRLLLLASEYGTGTGAGKYAYSRRSAL